MSTVRTLLTACEPTAPRVDHADVHQPLSGATAPANRSDVRLIALRETVSQPIVAAFCGGGVAGAVSRTVVSPLERLKILMQIQSVGRDAYKMSVGQALAKMWREEGWRGFMRGNGTNCIRIVPYSAVQFSSYNFYKRVCHYKSLACPGPSTYSGLAHIRDDAWCRTHPVYSPRLWWPCWYHVGVFHLPP